MKRKNKQTKVSSKQEQNVVNEERIGILKEIDKFGKFKVLREDQIFLLNGLKERLLTLNGGKS